MHVDKVLDVGLAAIVLGIATTRCGRSCFWSALTWRLLCLRGLVGSTRSFRVDVHAREPYFNIRCSRLTLSNEYQQLVFTHVSIQNPAYRSPSLSFSPPLFIVLFSHYFLKVSRCILTFVKTLILKSWSTNLSVAKTLKVVTRNPKK